MTTPDAEADDPVRRLQTAGARLAAVRAERHQAMALVGDAVRAAAAAGVTEVQIARHAGIDRMTVRKALGKR